MKSHALRLLFVLSIAINLGALSVIGWHHLAGGAQGPAAGGDAPPDTPSLGDELQLTDEQTLEFDRLYADLERRVAAGRERMRDRRRALFEILRSPSPDPSALEEVLVEIGAVQAGIQRAVADYLLAEARLLSPPQRARFVELLMERTRGEEQPTHLPLVGPRGAPRPGDRR